MTIFGPALSDLTLDDVERYLETADTEPLLWEAKGKELHPQSVRKNVCGFANSHEGGYLLLGVSNGEGGRWVCDGVTFPDREPQTWVVNVVTNPMGGVRPRPDLTFSRAWPTEDDRHVLVVHVAPTPTPPCITNGTLYERLPGKTPPVTDPQRLADLFRRGDEAHAAARQRADRAASILLRDWLADGAASLVNGEAASAPDADPEDCVRVALAVSACGYRPDIASRLFQPKLVQEVFDELSARKRSSPIHPTVYPVVWTQDASTWSSLQLDYVNSMTYVRASWDGAVAVGRVRGPLADTYGDRLLESMLTEWSTADRLSRESLGGIGPMYLTVMAAGRRLVGLSPDDPIVMQRGPLEPGAHQSVVESLGRELKRALGNIEPEPPPA